MRNNAPVYIWIISQAALAIVFFRAKYWCSLTFFCLTTLITKAVPSFTDVSPNAKPGFKGTHLPQELNVLMIMIKAGSVLH